MLKKWIKYAVRLLIGIFILITLLLFVTGIVFMVPSVQTKAARKAAAYLSREMQTEIRIDKLRVYWNLDVCLKGVAIHDLHREPMIVIDQACTRLPSYDLKNHSLDFMWMKMSGLFVRIANYQDEQGSNLTFFTRYFKSDRPKKKSLNLLIRNVNLQESDFAFFNERHPREDIPRTWNYSDIRFSSIQCDMRTMAIKDGVLIMDIDRLSLMEQSGFGIRHLQGKVSVGNDRIYCEEAVLKTEDGTDAALDFRFDFQSYSAFKSFYDSVYFRCTLRKSEIAVEDLKYFVPAFAPMDPHVVQLQADVTGPLSAFDIEHLLFRFNDSCQFRGDILTQGLPNAGETQWRVLLPEIAFSLKDLQGFVLPKGSVLRLPKSVENLSCYHGNVRFSGTFHDFDLDAWLQSNFGEVQVKGNLQDEQGKKRYFASVEAADLALNKLINSPMLGKLTATGTISGKDDNIDDYQVNIHSLQLNGYPLRQSSVSGDLEDGRLTLRLQADDPCLQASMKGFVDLQEENRPCYSTFDIRHADLSRLRLFRPDSNTSVAFNGSLQMDITDLDRIEGNISIEDAVYTEQQVAYPLHRINLLLKQSEREKQIQLLSLPLRFIATGNIPLNRIGTYARQWAHNYMPQVVTLPQETLLPEEDSLGFKAQLFIRENQQLLNAILPSVQFKEHVHITANPDTIRATAPALRIGNNDFEQLDVKVTTLADTACLQATCHRLLWNRSDTLSNFGDLRLTASCFRDTVPFQLTARKSDGTVRDNIDLQGILTAVPAAYDLHFDHGIICFDQEIFHLDSLNRIHFEKENIRLEHLRFASDSQALAIQGNYAPLLPMRLDLDIHQLNMGEFAWLMRPFKINAEGIANGEMTLLRDEYFQFVSQLDIKEFAFNEVSYGSLQLQTNWLDTVQLMDIQALIQKDSLPAIRMTGNYNPGDKTIDLLGGIHTFDLKSLSPFLSSFTSDIQGNASGTLRFQGPLQAAQLNGKILIEQALLRVDYLQTYYRMTQQPLWFEDSGFVFKQMQFVDEYGNKGTLNGVVRHKHLTNWGLDLDVDMRHLMALNTQYKDNDLFFGKAFVTGRVHLAQDGNLFSVYGDARTESPTYITLSLTRNTNVQMQNNYIVFEKPYALENEEHTAVETGVKKRNATQLLLNLTATPDATVKVNLDPSIGCTIVGNGNGDLRLELNENQKFEMYGSYTLSEGVVDLALGNILTRSLKLENGSYLSWNGRPENGQMKVMASYTTKTSISSLLNESATTSYRTVPMTTRLNLNGNLLNPDFDFTIRMDEVDESIQSLVYNVLDTTNKDAMLQQAFSLMLTGRLNVEANRVSAVNYGIGYSLSELSSYYLQKMISSITDKVNLGFQYIQGDGTSMVDEYNVQISTNLMENRLSIQGNLNIYGDNGMMEEQAVAGNVVGDIIFEYKITKDGSLRIKAFNLANYYDVLSSAYSDVPYYQGIGVVFSKDFNRLGDLFKKK